MCSIFIFKKLIHAYTFFKEKFPLFILEISLWFHCRCGQYFLPSNDVMYFEEKQMKLRRRIDFLPAFFLQGKLFFLVISFAYWSVGFKWMGRVWVLFFSLSLSFFLGGGHSLCGRSLWPRESLKKIGKLTERRLQRHAMNFDSFDVLPHFHLLSKQIFKSTN